MLSLMGELNTRQETEGSKRKALEFLILASVTGVNSAYRKNVSVQLKKARHDVGAGLNQGKQ